jgi:L-ascorbate metabolism protein UlaG (beta-lactamase superfamily)
VKSNSYKKTKAQPGNIMNAMLDCDSDISLCWVGNDGWIIHHNDITLAFDLDLLDSYRTAESPVSVMELAPYLDYLFITHEHNDHFHDRTADALNRESSCRFILPESCLTKADSFNIPEERRVIARPGQPFSLDGIEIEPVRVQVTSTHGAGDCFVGALCARLADGLSLEEACRAANAAAATFVSRQR